MSWMLWLIAGLVLMALELLAVDLAFYLLFFGMAAVGVGLVELAGAGLPVHMQWGLYAVLSVTAMFTLRERMYKRFRGGLPGFDNSSAGEIVDVNESVQPNHTIRVAMRGCTWDALNVGASEIKSGSKAEVVGLKGTVLLIEEPKDCEVGANLSQ